MQQNLMIINYADIKVYDVVLFNVFFTFSSQDSKKISKIF